jgi:hypothetical protein
MIRSIAIYLKEGCALLNKLDDFPVHQTPEPLAQPLNSDRNLYDRTWFNGYSADGNYYFGIGMAIYPHRGILDCAFSVIERGGRQHCFYGSRRAPLERTEMQVGPFRIEIIEPMRTARVTLDTNPSGITCDLMFSARTAAIQEGRQTLWNGARRVMDATRFDQFGQWAGHITYPDGNIKVEPAVCHGTKDRSWGNRNVGEPETGGAPQTPGGAFFLWAPLFWEDHISHAIFFDGMRGEPLHREALTARLYPQPADVPGVEDGSVERMAYVRHRVSYHPGTRLAAAAELDFEDLQGHIRTIRMEPILKFQMKGLGYAHPTWGQGMWQGELELGSEIFDPQSLDPLARENLHVQQVVRATDGSRQGIGVLEQVCIGPYGPAGFSKFLDGAR